MKDNFVSYKKYSNLEQALELKQILENNEIDVVLTDNVAPVDITFSGSTVQNQVEIKIKPTDFAKADTVLKNETSKYLDEIDKDYYLFQFTNNELYEILLKSDEWGEFDYNLAQKILKDRGKSVDEDMLFSLKRQRLEELAKPEASQKGWIVVGYILTFLGGFFGVIIGYLIWTSQKTLPNGQRVYSYNESNRKQGKYIFIIGLIILPIVLIIRILNEVQ